MTPKYKSNSSVMSAGYSGERGTSNPPADAPCSVSPSPAQQARSRLVADEVCADSDRRVERICGTGPSIAQGAWGMRAAHQLGQVMETAEEERIRYQLWLNEAG